MTQHVTPPDDTDDSEELSTEDLVRELSTDYDLPEPKITRTIGIGYTVVYAVDGDYYGFDLHDNTLISVYDKSSHIELRIQRLKQRIEAHQ